MCGIAGVLEFKSGRKPSREGLARMTAALSHRGPDEEGFFYQDQVGLAHRRLSIIDLSSGKQPMTTPDGQLSISFNGEIYNYPELRLELESLGVVFQTKSDTEVLLLLYRQYGVEAFPKLNGMFACAIWDRRTQELILARDRFGKKPLFYYRDNARFIFGSEVKALLAYGEVNREVDLHALHEYLTHGYIVGSRSIIEGISRVPPAHVLILKNGRVRCQSYWRFEIRPLECVPSEEEAIEQVRAHLCDAVKCRLMSEVPLGAFLSGGLDSSVIVAFMAQLSTRPVQTFTIGFEDADFSEADDARAVARHLGTEHHELIVKPSSLDILPDLVWHMDEPFGDSSSIPTYYVCRAARQHVTVALSGDGGDEVFAGYTRYQEIEQQQKLERLPSWIRHRVLRPLASALPFTAPGWNYLYAMTGLTTDGLPSGMGIYPYIHDYLYSDDLKTRLDGHDPFALMKELIEGTKSLDSVSRYQYLDTLQYLPSDILVKVDRMSMANSLEVRSPFLDYRLVEYVAGLPSTMKLRGSISKYILRKACESMLPSATLKKAKQGFAIPKKRWLQEDLQGAAHDLLLDSRTIQRGYFRKDSIQKMLNHHATGKRDYSNWIWCLMVLELWFRLYLDQASDRRIILATA